MPVVGTKCRCERCRKSNNPAGLNSSFCPACLPWQVVRFSRGFSSACFAGRLVVLAGSKEYHSCPFGLAHKRPLRITAKPNAAPSKSYPRWRTHLMRRSSVRGFLVRYLQLSSGRFDKSTGKPHAKHLSMGGGIHYDDIVTFPLHLSNRT